MKGLKPDISIMLDKDVFSCFLAQRRYNSCLKDRHFSKGCASANQILRRIMIMFETDTNTDKNRKCVSGQFLLCQRVCHV